MPINIPPKEKGSHTYSLRVGTKLCLLICVGSLPLLRSRFKEPSHSMPHYLHVCLNS
jgi:hypothetical protein